MSASAEHRKSNPEPLPHRIFLYGTLKRSQRNYFRLRNKEFGRARFVAAARTKEAFPLVIYTRWNIPFILHSPGKGQQVYGEIFEVDQSKMKWLDAFEDHPDIYCRDKVTCEIVSGDVIECGDRNDDAAGQSVVYDVRYDDADDSCAGNSQLQSDDVNADLFTEDDDVDRYEIGQEIEVWTYFLKDFPPQMSELETYSSYDSHGSHNKPYCLERFISVEDTYEGLAGRKRTREPPSKDNDL